MFNNKLFWINLAILALAGLLYRNAFSIGLTAIILSVLNGIIGVVALIIGKKETGLTLLLCCGVAFLIGFSVCSAM